MGAGRNPSYNPRTGKWTRPKAWYDKGRGRKKNGCYIATAVYGGYDCPQVWVLRRYRDECLSNKWYGRGFVSFYYAISPTLVKMFGKCNSFNSFFKPILDRIVNKLMQKGYSNKPYEDNNNLE